MRRAFILAIVVAAQVAVPHGGTAQQVDPCDPVPLPELCDEPGLEPAPSPPDLAPGGEPAPDPDSVEDGTDRPDGKGKEGNRRGSRPRQPRPQPFSLGGPKNTLRMMSILSVLPRYGMPLRRAVVRVVGPFPVAGLAWWTDDWHACRDGCRRLHEGLDIFAREGTPLVAVSDGAVTQKAVGSLAGISVEITDDQGVQYFYAHLSGWADGLHPGMRVRRGQVIGYVGNTGNAASTPAHLHFEVQPGGKPVPPKPFVDRWLRVAEQRAIDLVERVTGKPVAQVAIPENGFRLTRLFDLAGGAGTEAVAAQELLLIAGLQPGAPSLPVARTTVGRMAWEIDWRERAEAELAALLAEHRQSLVQEGFGSALPFGTEILATGSS